MAYRLVLKGFALAWILGISGCLNDCDRNAAATAPGPTTPDTVQTRKDLARLATSLPRIPMPMGTRYFSAPASAPAPKTGAVHACKDGKDIFAIRPNPRGILGIDSISYIDTLGIAHCSHQEPTIRETHGRYLFDPACGEAWERISIEISQDPFLSGYRSLSTGRIRLNSGFVADIEAYEVDMALDHSTGSPVFRNAHLRLAVPGGHSLRLELVKPHPFRAPDFFPYWENPPRGEPVMAGPVLLGTDTVGRAILYGDRTLDFLDAAGKPITSG